MTELISADSRKHARRSLADFDQMDQRTVEVSRSRLMLTILEDEREDVALPHGAQRLTQRKGRTAGSRHRGGFGCRHRGRSGRRRRGAFHVMILRSQPGQTTCQGEGGVLGLGVLFRRTHRNFEAAPDGALVEHELGRKQLLQLPEPRVCPTARILAANRRRRFVPPRRRSSRRPVR